MAMGLPVLAGGHAGQLFELAHEVQFVIIAAEQRQGGDGHFGNTQIEAGIPDPGMDDILNAGSAEKLFI